MNKRLKMTLLIVSLVFLAVLISYYTTELIIARSKTIKIVDKYYSSDIIKITKNDLSQIQLETFLTVQDPNFYQHNGVDLKTPGVGWTTITQSLCKKFYFKDFKQGIRKVKQTLCARFALNPLVDKDTQITLFLNIMYFGNETYGLHDAANLYYDKTVDELSEDEYISLIACLISPTTLNVKDNPEGNAQRVERIKKVLSGEYTPNGLFDITYEDADLIN